LLVDGTTIYAAATKNGVYFSSTSADNFTALAKGSLNTSNDFSVMEKVGNVLFLATLGKGLWKTDVTAHAWTQLGANKTNIYALKKDNVNGTDRLYVGVRTTGGFFYSVAPFTTLTQKTGSPNNIYSIAAAGGQLFVGTSDNGFYSVAVDNTDASIYNFTAQNTGIASNNRTNSIAVIGTTLYQGTQGRKLWKSSTTLPLSWTLCDFNITGVIPMLATDGTNLFAATVRGLKKTTNGGTSFTTIFSKETFRNWVKQITGKAGKLYARTDEGYYVSNSGNGGDWVPLGTGLDNSQTSYLTVGNSGTWAVSNSMIWKLNGANWEVKNQDFANDFFDMDKCNFQNVYEFNDGVNDVVIAGGWSNSAIFKSTDGGGTWATYDIATLTAGSTGLYFNSTTDQSQKIIFYEFAASKKYPGLIMATHKNRTQFSYDAGANWTWRLGNYKLNTGTSNIRSVLFRQYQGQEYFFMVTDITSGGLWSMANSVVDGTTNTGSVWTDLSASSGGESRNICEYSENLMFWRSGNPQVIRKSEDNGVTSEVFDTGLPRANASSLIYNNVVGQYMYASLNNDANVTVYRYDLSVTPAFVSSYPSISAFGVMSANILAKSTIPGKFYYVVLNPAAPAPNKDQIVAGKDGNGNAAIKFGASSVVLGNTDANVFLGSLLSGTTYKIYVVAKSEVVTFSDVVALDLTTLAQNADLVFSTEGNGTTNPATTVTYPAGTVVPVTATPNAGNRFAYWVIDNVTVSNASTNVTVVVTGSTAKAVFFETVQITTKQIGNGTIKTPTISPLTVDKGKKVKWDEVSVTGWRFDRWTIESSCLGYSEDVSVSIVRTALCDVTVTAVFKEQANISISAIGSGTVSPNTTFDVGKLITIYATPATDQKVLKWSVNGSETVTTATSFQFTVVSGANNVIVNFVPSTAQVANITISKVGNGTTVPASTSSYAVGSPVTVTATPNAGNRFAYWVIDNVTVSNASTDVTVTLGGNTAHAVFFETATINISAVGNGVVSPNATFDVGTLVEIYATPDPSFVVLKWTVNGSETITAATSFQYTVVSGANNVIVNFVSSTAQVANITISKLGNGTTVPAASTTDVVGSKITVTATPNVGNRFAYWVIDNVTVSNASTDVTITVGGNTAKAVFFETATINISAVGNGVVSPNATFDVGTLVEVYATADLNNKVQKWSVNGSETITAATAFQFTVVSGANNVVVTFQSTVSMTENMISNLSIYPNPTNGMLFVKNEGNLKSITLYDLAGKAISVKQVEGKQLIEINASKFQKGVYMLRITDNKGNVANHKFVKE